MRFFSFLIIFSLAACSSSVPISSVVPIESHSQHITYFQGVQRLTSNKRETAVTAILDPVEFQRNEGSPITLLIHNISAEDLLFEPRNITVQLHSSGGTLIPLKVSFYREMLEEAQPSGLARIGAGLQGFGVGVSNDPVKQAEFRREQAKSRELRDSLIAEIKNSALRQTNIRIGEAYTGYFQIGRLNLAEGESAALKINVPAASDIHTFTYELKR